MLCWFCWKEFESRYWKKYCCDECAKKAHNEQNKILAKEKRKREYICKKCWSIFYTHSWRNSYCENCQYKPWWHNVICWVCWKEFLCITNAKYCSKECSKIAHVRKRVKKDRVLKSICPICWWKKKSGSLHCRQCSYKLRDKKPNNKCKICWEETKTPHNNCCSISCATKYKRETTSTNKLRNHLNDLLLWKYNNWHNSKPNKEWWEFFDSVWLQYEKEYKIWNLFFDFKIDKYLIEINPTFTHNSTIPYRKWSEPLPEKYHMLKTIEWEKHWFNVITLFDWDNNDKVKHRLIWLLKWNKRLYWSEIKDVNWKEAFKFCEDNHLQWWINCSVRHWLYSNHWELISLMWWTRYPKKWYWELTRFVNKEWFYIAHWAEKLFKHFINEYKPNLIISYSDKTKHTGRLYDNLWFKCYEINKPWYWRVHKKTNKPYRRTSCRKDMMHLLPWFEWVNKYNKENLTDFWRHTEDELMSTHWYVKVFNCWNRRHVFYIS